MICPNAKLKYRYLYPHGVRLLAFAFWWTYIVPTHDEAQSDDVIREAYEAWLQATFSQL